MSEEPTIIEGSSVEIAAPPAPSAVIVAPSEGRMERVTIDKLVTLNAALNGDLNRNELALFAEVANRSGLDPFAKQIYAIRRKGKVSFQTGIDGYRSIAARTGEYDGQDEPVYGPMVTTRAHPWEHPEHASVRAYRKGMGRGVAATAYWDDYAPTDERDQFMWRKMGRVMIAKVAEALALRKAFPYVYGGLYTDDEMDQADGGVVAPRPSPVTAGVVSSGPASPPPAIPAGPVAPGMEVYQGTVQKEIDGVRSTASGPKAELAFIVGRNKHTAMILGQWAYAIAELGIQVGDEVRVHGHKVEIEWQAGKPKKKEIHDVAAVEHLSGDQWSLHQPAGMPLEDSTASHTPHAAAAVTEAFPDDFVPGRVQPDDEIDGPPMWDDDLAQPAPPPEPEPHPVVVEQALPARPEVADHGLDIPFATGEGTVDFIGVVNVNRDETGKNGATFRYLEVGTADVAYKCAVLLADLDAIRPTRFWSGSRARVIGGWSSSGKVVVVTHMEPA